MSDAAQRQREQEERLKAKVIDTLTSAFEKGQVSRPETGGLDATETAFLNSKGVDARLERELEQQASHSFEAQMKKLMRSMSED